MQSKLPTLKSKTIILKANKISNFCQKDEYLEPFSSTKQCYGYKFSQGGLEIGHGISHLAINGNEISESTSCINGLWSLTWNDPQTKKDNYYIFYLNAENELCFFNVTERNNVVKTGIVFKQTPASVQLVTKSGGDTIFFSSAEDKTIAYNGSGATEYENLPQFKSACWHGQYLFLITPEQKNKLYYSDNKFDNWRPSVPVEVEIPHIRGGMTKLISQGDLLYIFREYGITAVTLYSTQSLIASENIYDASSYIYESTISKLGEDTIFLTSDGLYSLSAKSVRKLNFALLNQIDFSQAESFRSVCHEGKYYLACRMKDDESCEKNNALVIFDPSQSSFEIVKGVDIKDMLSLLLPSQNKVCLVLRGEHDGKVCMLDDSGTIFGKALARKWLSVKSDFGEIGKLKRITHISFRPHSQCKFTVTSDLGVSSIEVKDYPFSQRIHTNILGNEFDICIEDSTNKISFPELTIKV